MLEGIGEKEEPDECSISGRMTAALAVYSAVFARYALAVTPKNYLLFGCHVINFSAQLTQGYRWTAYWQ
jgi:mitochondrial pyruvate carrier 1